MRSPLRTLLAITVLCLTLLVGAALPAGAEARPSLCVDAFGVVQYCIDY